MMRRTLSTIFVTLVLLASATGCGLVNGSSNNAASQTSSRPEQSKIRLGLLPVVDIASVYLAINDGYFRQEGLDIDLVTIQSGAYAIPSLTEGKLDVVFGNYVSFFAAQAEKKASIKFVADSTYATPNTWMVLAAPDSPVKKPSDLPGHKIGVTAPHSLAELTIRSVLAANGVESKNVTFVPMGYPEMADKMKKGEVDAALLAEPFITQAEKTIGALPVFDAASGPTADFPIAGFGALEKYAADNPKTIAAFQRAFAKGQEAAANDRSRVEQLIQDYAKIDPQTAALVNLPGFPTSMDASRLQRVPDLMQEFGVTTERIDVKPMLLNPTGT